MGLVGGDMALARWSNGRVHGLRALCICSDFAMNAVGLTLFGLMGLGLAACDGAGCGSQWCAPAEAICPATLPDAVVEVECKYFNTGRLFTITAVYHRPGAPVAPYAVGGQVTPLVNVKWTDLPSTCDSLATVHGKMVDFRASIRDEEVRRTGPNTPLVPKDKAIAALLALPTQCRAMMEAAAARGSPCSPGDPCR